MSFDRMMQRLHCGVCWLALLVVTAASADEQPVPAVRLVLTPDTCVTLQQGRPCYATVDVHWQSQSPQSFCLHAGGDALYCWPESQSGYWRYEFVAVESQQLQLVSAGRVLAEAQLKVNWVQKNPKVKRHWRLF